MGNSGQTLSSNFLKCDFVFLQAFSHNELRAGSNLGRFDERMKKEDASQLSAKGIIDVFLSFEAIADIILLFRRNPTLVDSGDGIAARIGRNGKSIRRDLKKLTNLGILHMEKIGKQSWFGFDSKRDRQIQEIIKNYIRSCAECTGENYCRSAYTNQKRFHNIDHVGRVGRQLLVI